MGFLSRLGFDVSLSFVSKERITVVPVVVVGVLFLIMCVRCVIFAPG